MCRKFHWFYRSLLWNHIPGLFFNAQQKWRIYVAATKDKMSIWKGDPKATNGNLEIGPYVLWIICPFYCITRTTTHGYKRCTFNISKKLRSFIEWNIYIMLWIVRETIEIKTLCLRYMTSLSLNFAKYIFHHQIR